MAWKLGTLQKGLVLDMPLTSKYHNPGTDIFTDKTPYSNHGTNNGADIGTDHSTFVAANSDYVNCGNDVRLNHGAERSISLWAKTASVIDHHQLISNDFDSGVSGIRLGYIAGDLRAYWFDTVGSLKYLSADSNPTIGEWFYIAFGLSGGTAKLYINNIVQQDTKSFNSIATSNLNTYLGTLNGAIQFYNGDLAHPRMWNRALTAAEWALAFDQEKGLYL